MSETNRRKFLAAAGAGTAAGIVGIGAPAYASVRRGQSAQETVVAYVEDHRGSTVTLLVGDREVVVQDRDLVVRLLNAAGGQ